MDEFPIYFVLLLVVGTVLLLPIMAFVRSGEARRTAEALREEIRSLRAEIGRTTARIVGLEKALERALEKLENRPGGVQGPEVAATGRAEKSAAETAKTPVVSLDVDKSEAPHQVPARVAPTATPIPSIFSAGGLVSTIPRVPDAGARISSSTPALEVPSIFSTSSGGSASSLATGKKRNWADMEETLGANWLNKIGTAAFVIGVALLLNYSMHYLGPVGKIVLGYALSAALLGIGIFGETKQRYRIATRAVLGGGWALAYFTTYALHNVQSVRLVESAGLGFALLFAVAVAMVAHSLRYDSELATGFAYLLAFVTVAISEIPMGGLVASALLAASLVVILRGRRWFVVEPLAIIATYAVHWMWLDQVYEKMGAYRPFPEFPMSLALLTAYWAIYLTSYFLREDKTQRESNLLTASFLLNAAGYLALLHHQSFHPEWRFWFLLAAGAVYLGVSAYSQRSGRRLGFILASTLGAAMMIAAVPYRYSGARLEILWLVDIEALLIAAWRLSEKHLRKLGWAGAAVLTTYVWLHDVMPRVDRWRPPDAKLGWLFLLLAAALFVDGWLKARVGEDWDAMDTVAFVLAPICATGFLLAAEWVALPLMWTALAWVISAMALVECGRKFKDRALEWCGHGAAALAVTRLLILNLQRDDMWHHVSLRLITVAASCATLYVASRWHVIAEKDGAAPAKDAGDFFLRLTTSAGISGVYTAASTVLAGYLLWVEATSGVVGLAWGLFGLVLIEAAGLTRDKALLWQGRALLAASFARIFFADLNSTSRLGALPVPVISVTILAAIYYYCAFTSEDSPRTRSGLLWMGTISIAALLRFEMPPGWVAVGWAAMAVTLYFASGALREETFRAQCYAMTLLAGVRCGFDNFYRVGPLRFTNVRTVTVTACALLLYVLFAAAKLAKRELNRKDPGEAEERKGGEAGLGYAWRSIEAYPQHLFFFVPTILLTILVSLEVRRGFLTAAWGIEGLIVFLAVLKMDERAYRWFSLSLFMLCVARIVTVDVWNFDALGRIVSFLGLGVALLGVSFLYARHRELLRRVL
ncbi:MAG: DUF2339 domain-containing protein [Candidatus Acidiferrales bacterium]